METPVQPFDGAKARALLGLDGTADEGTLETTLGEAAAALAAAAAPVAPIDGAKLRELLGLPAEADDAQVEQRLAEAATALQNRSAAGNPPEEEEEGPPEPIHDPQRNARRAAEANQDPSNGAALIAAIQKEGKFKSYMSARTEARRRKPEFFP